MRYPRADLSGADDNAIDIPAQNSTIPDARFFHQRDIADDSGIGRNVSGGMNARAEFQTSVDAGVTNGKWICWDRKFHRSATGSLDFARDDAGMCSHFFITEAN